MVIKRVQVVVVVCILTMIGLVLQGDYVQNQYYYSTSHHDDIHTLSTEYHYPKPKRKQIEFNASTLLNDEEVNGMVLGRDLPPLLADTQRGGHFIYYTSDLRWAMWQNGLWTHEPGQKYTVCETPADLKPMLLQVIKAYRDRDPRWDMWEFVNGSYIPCRYANKNVIEDIKAVSCGNGMVIECGASLYHLGRQPSIHFDGHMETTMKFFNMLRKYRTPINSWSVSIAEESIVNYPLSVEPVRLSQMNFSIGYDDSIFDIPIFPFAATFYDALRNPPPLTPFTDRNETAHVAWVSSNCDALSNRTAIMRELMQYMPVDSYGSCLHNKEFPPEIGADRNIQKQYVYKKYLFTISIESSITHDYISEMLWEPLVEGIVPMYLGAVNVEDYTPPHSIIHFRNFNSLKELAAFVIKVANDPDLYYKFHEWRNTKWDNKALEWRVKNTKAVPSQDCVTSELIHTGQFTTDYVTPTVKFFQE